MSDDLHDEIRGIDRAAPDAERAPDKHMTAAEMRCVTEYLGLTQADLAVILHADERRVRRWLSGPTPIRSNTIPTSVRVTLEDLEVVTASVIGELVAALRGDEGPVVVYRTDEDLWAARPDVRPLPARWWRHVVMRAAVEVPGLGIRFAGESGRGVPGE